MDIPIETMKRMRLRPNDVVVIKTENLLGMEEAQHIEKMMKEVLFKTGIPNLQVIIMDAGLDVEVLGKEESIKLLPYALLKKWWG